MEKAVEILFNEIVMEEFKKKFGLDNTYKKLGDFENYVFRVLKSGKPYILRITHSSHRSFANLDSEIDWMNFLHMHQVSCPEAFRSLNGHLIEEYHNEDGSVFFASLFSEVKGEAIRVQSEEFNSVLFYSWGKAIGQMHACTKAYEPKEGIQKRPQWHEEELLQVEKYVSEEDHLIVQYSKELIRQIKYLPIEKDNFGLIHTDVHSGNFFYDGETINVFDFDDCCYHWFASDIAIPLYYSILYGWMDKREQEREEFAQYFMNYFLKGYTEVNVLPNGWKEQLPLFLKLRDIELYAVLHKKIIPEERNSRIEAMLIGIRQRILKKLPIVNI
jgi:amicoumacin kinase